MQESDFQKIEVGDSELKGRVDVREWDFTQVPRDEEQACCYYEYARESSWLVEQINNLRAQEKLERLLRKKLQKSILIYALPPVGFVVNGIPVGRQKSFDGRPWLAQEAEWRQQFCQKIANLKAGLSYAPILEKKSERAFCVGFAPHFSSVKRWDEEQRTRLLDTETGLEVLLVTVDWSSFTDTEIIEHFTKWLKSKEGRPKSVGLKTKQGKRADAWRKKLDRLALLRLRHHYSLDELPAVLPEAWRDASKFNDSIEIERERKVARRTLFELFSFLPKDIEPISWSRRENS